MKFRLANLLVVPVLLAPLVICVGCECKNDSDCPQQIVAGYVNGKLTNGAVPGKCHDKHCEP